MRMHRSLPFTSRSRSERDDCDILCGRVAILERCRLVTHHRFQAARLSPFRFAIREGGRTVGAGVVAEIIE